MAAKKQRKIDNDYRPPSDPMGADERGNVRMLTPEEFAKRCGARRAEETADGVVWPRPTASDVDRW